MRIVALDTSRDLDTFRSGNPSLDDWLLRHAQNATGHGTRTFVAVDDDDRVVGYFSVVPHLVGRAEAPGRIARGAPREIPAILLAKLALSEDMQGRGLGSELLVLALDLVLDAALVAGGKVVVVDAIDDEAVAFYEHHDFIPLPHRPDRLVMKLSTVARALGRPWP